MILVFLPFVSSFASTQDTIYVMRSGMVVYKKAITDMDSISFENWKFNRRSITNKIAEDKNYSIFYQGLVATGLVDSLKVDRDKGYKPSAYVSFLKSYGITQGSGSKDELPAVRRYGFTVLMESDATYIDKYGITNIEQLKTKAKEIYDQVYPEDANITDVTNRRNSLNRFIAYHLVNKLLNYNQIIKAYDTPHMIKSFDMYEYLEPMCANTLIEARIVRTDGNHDFSLNMTNTVDDAVHIVKSYSDIASNGVYHEIDKILAYDNDVLNMMSNKRLRFDMASLFPELTNNNMRGYKGDVINQDVRSWLFPKGYIGRLTCAEGTRFSYLNAFGGYIDYQGDEGYFAGVYDFSFTTLPVPAGTYEVRLCHQPTGGRGIAEFYVDSLPAGIPAGVPVDLRIDADSPEIGYVVPGIDLTDPYGYENDKMMRNHGYMKGPATYKDVLGIWYGKKIARQSNRVLRKILGTYTFSAAGNHKISVKGYVNGQFMIDFIEFVPVSALESEDLN